MKGFRKILFVLIAVTLLLLSDVAVFAHEVPSYDKKCSITLNMNFDGEPVTGGELTCYKVGDVTENDGNYFFTLAPEYEESGVVLSTSTDGLVAPETAQALEAYVNTANLKGTTAVVSSTGTVRFENLEIGLYLLLQNTPSDGFNSIAPFLVSLPMEEDGVYLYDVDVSPKVELERAPATQPPTVQPDEKLPQTGQLNWPVPVLVTLGLFLVLLGTFLAKGKKNET